MNEQIKDLEPSDDLQAELSPQDGLEPQTDNLLSTVEYFCIHHRVPFAKERVFRGLPSQDINLAPRNYVAACENVGLHAKLLRNRPSDVSEMVYPFLVFFKNGSVGVVHTKTTEGKLEVKIWDRKGGEEDKVYTTTGCDRVTVHTIGLVTRMPEDSSPARQSEKEPGHWFWSSVRKFWPNWLYVTFATLFINLLGLALPLFVLNVYDRVIPNNSMSTLWALTLGVTVAMVFDLLLKIMRSAMIDNSSKRIDLGVSARLFEHALDVKMDERPKRSGELASHVREFESVREFFSSGAITSLIDLLFIGVFLGFLWYIVGPLALVPLIAVPVVLFITLLVQFPLYRTIRNSQTASASRHSVLVESLIGIETVKSISAEGAMQRRWEDSVAEAARAGAATRFWSSLAIYCTMFAQQAVSVIIIVWGVFLIAAGDITIGALIASNILAGRILAPLGGISSTLVRAQQSFAALANLNKLMKLGRDNPKNRGGGAGISSGHIEFRETDFVYPEQSAPALDNISLKITAGERVAIIGRVGSGKSTLGRLICGLYEPTDGGVLVDGTDTRHHDKAALHRAAVYVGQETELFTGTLRENVLLARPDRADMLESCLNAAGVTAFASRHPLGLEMPVGERGQSLSGGQKQSVGIARAMLIDPKIMFLDEPTAQMDTMTEAAFVNSFTNWLTPGVTLVVATHRNTLLSLVDRIIVIENGKVTLDGPKTHVLQALEGRSGRATNT